MTRVLLGLIAALVIALLLDGLSKRWAEEALVLNQPVPIVGELFQLTLNYNTGVAFGLFATDGVWVVLLTGAIILGLLVFVGSTLQGGALPPVAGWPIGFLLGGAIANFADRLPDGRVTDFLDFGLVAARWPTFNLADSFIVLGMLALVLITSCNRGSGENERQGFENKEMV